MSDEPIEDFVTDCCCRLRQNCPGKGHMTRKLTFMPLASYSRKWSYRGIPEWSGSVSYATYASSA